MGFTKNDFAFIWQIGVVPKFQKQGISTILLQNFVDSAKSSGVKRIFTTIAPKNINSYGTFSSFCSKNNFLLQKVRNVSVLDSTLVEAEYETLFQINL